MNYVELVNSVLEYEDYDTEEVVEHKENFINQRDGATHLSVENS